jgi:hypothetical protein
VSANRRVLVSVPPPGCSATVREAMVAAHTVCLSRWLTGRTVRANAMVSSRSEFCAIGVKSTWAWALSLRGRPGSNCDGNECSIAVQAASGNRRRTRPGRDDGYGW